MPYKDPIILKQKSFEYREKNREKLKLIAKRYREKNKIKIKKRLKLYALKNPEKIKLAKRKQALKKRYNITFDQYNEMFKKQEGKCAICKTHEKELNKILFVDHDHKTNKARELLCHKCNVALSYFENYDSEPFIKYLKKHREKLN